MLSQNMCGLTSVLAGFKWNIGDFIASNCCFLKQKRADDQNGLIWSLLSVHSLKAEPAIYLALHFHKAGGLARDTLKEKAGKYSRTIMM